MKLRVFIDTNVFIFAKEFPESNSHKIIELLNENKIEAIISERVFAEVISYFKRNYNGRVVNYFRQYLLNSCTIIPSSKVKNEISLYKGKIKDKDLEQIAVVKKLGLKYLIAYDRDFENFEEYTTPRKFIESLGLHAEKTEH